MRRGNRKPRIKITATLAIAIIQERLQYLENYYKTLREQEKIERGVMDPDWVAELRQVKARIQENETMLKYCMLWFHTGEPPRMVKDPAKEYIPEINGDVPVEETTRDRFFGPHFGSSFISGALPKA